MNQFISFFRKRNEGFISIQVVIVGGIIIGFGAMSIEAFHQSGSVQVANTVSTLDKEFSTPEMNEIFNR